MLGVRLDQGPLFEDDDPSYVALYAALVKETLRTYKRFHGPEAVPS